jgi:hypothetical protein
VISKIKNPQNLASLSHIFQKKSFVQVALAFFMGHQNAKFHQKNNTEAHTHKLDM